MKRIVLILAVLVAAGAALAWVAVGAEAALYARLNGRRSALPATPPPGGSSSSPAAASPATSRPARMTRCGSAAGSNSRRRSDRSTRRTSRAIRSTGSARWRPVDIANALLSGVSRDGRQSLSGLPLHVVPADDAEGRRRPRRVPAHAAGGSGPGAGERSQPFPFPFAAPWACGSCSISTTPAFAPILRRASNGTAAATSSKAPAIAANVTRRADFLGADGRDAGARGRAVA